MEEQQNPLTYEIIKAAVAGEKWATEKVVAHYDSYIEELATVKERQPDGSVRTYVDEDMKQSIILNLLENEKYKGDALLQKSYTVDFLTKMRTQNKGETQMYYVEDDHEAIISKRIWECVQLEAERRKKYLEEHGTNSYSRRPENNPVD